ncbi:MAG: pilus assembly protein PilV [Betaproteobacteria bacterium]|nr:pilus assembly protein PilV [Betaproteobacteria bacterium]
MMNRLPRSSRAHAPRKAARGIALIEVLVAMLIFMLGILGLVGLQSSVTRAQTDAKFRADAAYLASEGVARLWADLPNMNNYSGAGCAGISSCKAWQDKVAASLPNGTGTLTIDATTGDVAVVITWTPPNGEPHQYVTHTTVMANPNS